MTAGQTAAAVTRRRFLLIAAAAAAGPLAAACSVAGAATEPRLGTQPSQAATAPTSGSSLPGGLPRPLRGNGARREPGAPDVARISLSDFGADFLRSARTLDSGAANMAISPYSLFAVLAMARAGARGTTAGQIDAALHSAGVEAQGAVISAVDVGVAAAIAAADQSAQDEDEPILISAANQTWVQDGLAVHQDYLDALAVQFGVEAVVADFAADPEKVRAALNAWVAQRTHDLVPNLFPAGSIDPATRIVLVNALYLKASWAKAFTAVTERTTFVTAGGIRTHPPMMRTTSGVGGTSGAGWNAASIPYRGGGAVMTILVPDTGRFESVLAKLDNTLMREASGTATPTMLSVPLFDLQTTSPAKDVAAALGIKDIFAGGADLSGIMGRPGDLIATDLVHKVVVIINENGTAAAAASAVIIAESSAQTPQVQLTADRPFMFWISETTTGAPLFLGVVTDPSR